MGGIYFVSSQLCSPTWTCNASGMHTVVEKSLHQCASMHIGEQRDMKAEIVRVVLTETPTPPEAIYELVYDKDTDELEGITGNIRCDCKRPISGRVALAGAGGNAVLSERKERTERGGHTLDKDEHDDVKVEICPDQEVAENKEGVKHIPNAHGPGGRAEEGEMEAGWSEAGTRRRRRGGEGGPRDTAGLRARGSPPSHPLVLAKGRRQP